MSPKQTLVDGLVDGSLLLSQSTLPVKRWGNYGSRVYFILIFLSSLLLRCERDAAGMREEVGIAARREQDDARRI